MWGEGVDKCVGGEEGKVWGSDVDILGDGKGVLWFLRGC